MSHRIDLLLPLRLRRIFYKLLAGLANRDEAGYRSYQRVALLFCEIEREIGTAKLKTLIRRVDRITSQAR
jgi:hypothetical protein